MQAIKSALLLLLAALFVQCQQSQISGERLQAGDLLFQDLNCGEMCDAIEAVTEGVDGKDFSHCAMVVEVNDSLKVIEAISKGVRLTSLSDFFSRSGDTATIRNITVSRLKPEYSTLIEKASSYALQQLGAPYDREFLMNNGSWYCSELLYESFKAASGEEFFELQPMTFKDPESKDYFPAWVDYFQELGLEIPEGKPGLNPGSISRSDKLEIVRMDQ